MARRSLSVAGGLLAATVVLAPWPILAADSRAEEIQEARRQKAARLSPPVQKGAEKFLLAVERDDFIARFTSGLGVLPRIGGLPTGQGFAIGPQYKSDRIAGGKVVFRTSAAFSSASAYLMDAEVTFPHLGTDRVFGNLLAIHRNLPRMEYYGPGPDSGLGSRSTFRLEDTSFDGQLGLRPLSYLRLGLKGGFTQVNVGAGTRPGVAVTDEVFTPLTTPGIIDQTDFLKAGGFLAFDYRDNPFGPRSGGMYAADFTYFDDQDLKLHTFRRLSLEAQQYFPFFNGKRVFAFRGRTVMTWASPGQSVPFYMQPHLGGSEDLRGFRTYRFYDDNHIILNAEYRWEAFAGLDMALFFDAGKVVPRRTQINFHDLEGSVGFGFRFNVRNSTAIRLDFGFSHEGYQIWFKFGNPF